MLCRVTRTSDEYGKNPPKPHPECYEVKDKDGDTLWYLKINDMRDLAHFLESVRENVVISGSPAYVHPDDQDYTELTIEIYDTYRE